MASPNAQLRDIYEELTRRFADTPSIEVVPLDDDPPEKYEVRFHVLGLHQDPDGTVQESREHAIFINIPFGYPHFPPSCTPKTPTFHPDFDQAAICIGEYWDKGKTLGDLIIHIARMISGEIYSTDNVFNDAALAWYRKIANQLPFEEISLDTGTAAVNDEPLELEEDDRLDQGLDTLDDEDFFGGPTLPDGNTAVDDTEEIDLPHTPKASGKSSINRIHLLIRQHRYHELFSVLSNLPPGEQFEDREEIEEKIHSLVERATQLQQEGDEAEHLGDPKTALLKFQQTAELVPDFPGIEESIERAKNSVDLASEEWTTPDDEEPTPESDGQPGGEKQKKRLAFFEETSRKTFRFLPLLAVAVLLVLAAIFITPFFGARSKIEEARSLHRQCTDLVDAGQFARARSECEAALATLEGISLFKTDAKNELERQLKNLLTSEKMVEGLAGRVLYQGRYVNKVDMDRVLQFNDQKQAADKLFQQEKWKLAADKYTEALKTAAPISDNFEETLLSRIEERIRYAEIELAIIRAESLLERGELEKSHDQFRDALTRAASLPEETGGQLVAAIEPKMREIEYLQHLDLGRKYFDANDWEAAIRQYEQALKLRAGKGQADSGLDDSASLYANMAEAELFAIINDAKDAFSRSQWQGAISKYREAIELLDAKGELLQRINPAEIKQQLQRIILRTRIVQFKQQADRALESSQYGEAVTALEKVVEAVVNSGLEDDEEFKDIIAGTRQTIGEIRSKAAISRRIAYLERNYKAIFAANYSAAVPEKLSKPQASFLRYVDGRELYQLECLENNLGRKLRLVMLYSYDPATASWQFYSGQR